MTTKKAPKKNGRNATRKKDALRTRKPAAPPEERAPRDRSAALADPFAERDGLTFDDERFLREREERTRAASAVLEYEEEVRDKVDLEPLELLESVVRDGSLNLGARVHAAIAALPYRHKKKPVAVEVEGDLSHTHLELTPKELKNMSTEELRVLSKVMKRVGAERKEAAAVEKERRK